MFRKLHGVIVFILALSVLTTFAFNGSVSNRAEDEKAIRRHVEQIFDAYVKGDRETIRATHSVNWRGFLTGSNNIVKGIEGYMKGARIRDPKNPDGMVGYKFLEYDTVFYGEAAVVSYIAEIFFKEGTISRSSKLRSIDVYAKENGKWNQVASNISPLPQGIAEAMSTLRPISPQLREYLLKGRDEVWQAFFSNDVAKLQKLIPPETVAINPGEGKFDNQTSIFAAAKAFAESGAKLVKIEFPLTEIQVYGATVIMYSNYVYEIESKGERKTFSGRATEIFVLSESNGFRNVGWHLDLGK